MNEIKGTYSELALILNTSCQGVDHVKGEIILANVEVFETFETSQICEEGTDSVLILNYIVLESQRLKFRQAGHLTSEVHNLIIGERPVTHVNLMATTQNQGHQEVKQRAIMKGTYEGFQQLLQHQSS